MRWGCLLGRSALGLGKTDGPAPPEWLAPERPLTGDVEPSHLHPSSSLPSLNPPLLTVILMGPLWKHFRQFFSELANYIYGNL